MVIARRHRQRLAKQGFGKSVLYYLFTVLLTRLGVSVHHVFQRGTIPARQHRPEGVEFAVAESSQQLRPADWEVLKAYGEEPLLQEFAAAFARRERCALARCADGKLGCVCWIVSLQGFPRAGHGRCVVIQRCFTVPEHRGEGLYPLTINSACNDVRRTMGEGIPIFMESSVWNFASTQGIEKAGFVKVGVRLVIGRWNWYWPTAGRQHEGGQGCDSSSKVSSDGSANE